VKKTAKRGPCLPVLLTKYSWGDQIKKELGWPSSMYRERRGAWNSVVGKSEAQMGC